MRGRVQALKGDIKAELNAIARIYEALPQPTSGPSDAGETIVAGYHLHNLYNAFESVFRLVAAAFENDVPDATQWHRLLLERMGRAIEGVRPALLSPEAVVALDELRRFRHLFRHLYQAELDASGVATALRRAWQLQGMYKEEVGAFLSFLDGLTEPEGPGQG